VSFYAKDTDGMVKSSTWRRGWLVDCNLANIALQLSGTDKYCFSVRVNDKYCFTSEQAVFCILVVEKIACSGQQAISIVLHLGYRKNCLLTRARNFSCLIRQHRFITDNHMRSFV
jgi:hypothetical protein